VYVSSNAKGEIEERELAVRYLGDAATLRPEAIAA
jgi:hypothetical protein